MTSTRWSLLQNASSGNELAWEKLAEVYQPMINGWLIRQGISAVDAEEISQEVLIVVLRKLKEFDHSGNRGAFRCWLRTITSNQIRTYARKHFQKPGGVGGSEFLTRVNNLLDDGSQMSREWDQQHDRCVIRGLLNAISQQIEPQTIEIFERLVLDEVSVTDVAEQFNVSVGAVYSAKSRVLRRIRQSGQDLLDDSQF